jgi:hypothetical protein
MRPWAAVAGSHTTRTRVGWYCRGMRGSRMILALVAACGPSPGTGDADTTADTETTAAAPTSGPAPTSSEDGTSPSSSSTSGEPGSGSSASGTMSTTGEPTTNGPGSGPDATDTGSETGEPVCAGPDAEAVVASWELAVDGAPPPLDGLSAPCVVLASEVLDTLWMFDLECEQSEGETVVVSFVVERSPGPASDPLFVDQTVLLDYRAQQIFWTNQWFAIHLATNPGLVLVSGSSADSPVPPDSTALDFFGLELAVQDGLCGPIDDAGACPPTIRLALDMAWSSAKRRLFDGQSGALVDFAGDINVWVARATRPEKESNCDDAPPAWFEVVMTGTFGP